MGAREILLALFVPLPEDDEQGAGARENLVDEILGEHARELAAKQRQAHGWAGGCGLGACCGDALADLIDPDAEKNGLFGPGPRES